MFSSRVLVVLVHKLCVPIYKAFSYSHNEIFTVIFTALFVNYYDQESAFQHDDVIN